MAMPAGARMGTGFSSSQLSLRGCLGTREGQRIPLDKPVGVQKPPAPLSQAEFFRTNPKECGSCLGAKLTMTCIDAPVIGRN